MKPMKDRSLALILEILPGLFGFLGFGWIYADNTQTGILILIGNFILIGINVVVVSLSGGICCFVAVPVEIAALALSAYKLNQYMDTRSDIFPPRTSR